MKIRKLPLLLLVLVFLTGLLPFGSGVQAATSIIFTDTCTHRAANTMAMNSEQSITTSYEDAPAGNIDYIGDIGSATSKTSGTSLSITTTAAASDGDDIIVAYATDPNSSIPPITVTDTAGNIYHEIALGLNSGQLRTYLFTSYNINALPADSTITITASASVTARAAVVSVFRGLADEEVLDQISTGENDASTSATSGTTASTTEADELLIGVIGTEGPEGDTAGTWQDSFTTGLRRGTTGGLDDTNITVSLGYRIVSEAGSFSAAKIGMTQRDHASIIATFRAEPPGDAPRITVTGTPLSAFTSIPGISSATQNYKVTGTNLVDNINITAPADFQLSLTSGSGYSNSLTLEATTGSVTETTIFVLFYRDAAGTSTGSITHTSSGATTRNVSVTGTATMPDFNILLGRPTDHSVTANIIPNLSGQFYIEYGITSGIYTGHTDNFTCLANEPVEIVVDGLTANIKYFYRISFITSLGVPPVALSESSFRTQRAPGEAFTFTIASDSHLGQYGGQTADELDLYRQTMNNIDADNPDFHIDLGDTFAMDPSPLGTGMTDAEAKAAYLVQRPYMDIISDAAPVYLVLGNHENEEGWNVNDVFTAPDQSLALVGMKYRKLYYPNPVPDSFYSGNTDPLTNPIGGDTNREDYYAWTWGDALFVALDPYHYSMTWPNENNEGYGGEGQDGEASGDRWDWTLGIEQYLWLKQTLENSTAKYKFVMSHHVTGGETNYGRGGISAAPYFEWGGKNADGTWGWDTERPASAGWDVPIHQMMVDNHVTAYIHGHDHMYAYEELDGIAYIECPKPDDAGYTWQPYSYGQIENLYPEAIAMIQNSGYLRLTVSPENTTIEYVRSFLAGDGTNGQIADTRILLPYSQTSKHIISDFDGDGKTDISVFRPSTGTWFVINSHDSSQFVLGGWGMTGDVPVAGDFDGDGKNDIAVFRPSTGTWFIINSLDSSQFVLGGWGMTGDVPVAGDFDGDGKNDIAVFRPSTGTWFIINSLDSSQYVLGGWGMTGDVPVTGDFDGDGKNDIAVFRPSTGTWFIINSLDSSQYVLGSWGMTGDVPVTGDFDGDGKNDIAVFRPSTGTWFIINSLDSSQYVLGGWGMTGDIPVTGDFDNDGKTDIAVFRPSTGTWFIINSLDSSQYVLGGWGISEDIPLP